MSAWLPIEYRDFYDVPTLFVVTYHGILYVFDAPFDEDSDGYPDYYTVYILPEAALRLIELDSWENLSAAGEPIGEVPVADVKFDESKRRLISSDVLSGLRGAM